jgi:two-component system response regulator (stage 0 sporulation protein F)
MNGEVIMPNILIIDDQPYLKKLFSDDLKEEGYRVMSAGDAKSVRGFLEDSKPDLVLLELSLDGFEGWSLLRYIKSKEPDLPVLIVTAYDNYMNDPRLSQADGYLVKDFAHLNKLKERIADVLGRGVVS